MAEFANSIISSAREVEVCLFYEGEGGEHKSTARGLVDISKIAAKRNALCSFERH